MRTEARLEATLFLLVRAVAVVEGGSCCFAEVRDERKW